MRIESHDAFQSTTNTTATRVVIYDLHDNPIALVVEVDGGRYVAATAANKQFKQLLKTLGIDKTLVVEHIDAGDIGPRD